MWRFYVSEERAIPYMPILGVAYAIYYVLPLFHTRPFFLAAVGPDVGFRAVEYASKLVFLGVVSLMIGAYGTGGVIKKLGRVRRELDFDRALPVLAVVSVISFVVRVLTSKNANMGSAAEFFIVVDRWGEAALSVFLVAWARGRAHAWHKIFALTSSLALVGSGLATGLLSQAVFPIVGFVLVYSWEKRRIPWGFLLLRALVVAAFHLSKAQFRATDWAGADHPEHAHNALTNLGDFLSITYEQLTSGDITVDDGEAANASRTNALAYMAIVAGETPRSVPYWEGYTYADVLWHFIPRVIVPENPAPRFGQ
jgi:hypothetical protein